MWSGDPLRHLWNFNAMHKWRSSSSMSQIFSPSIDIDINVNVSSSITESSLPVLTSQNDLIANFDKDQTYNDTASILLSPLAMDIPQAIATAISLSAIMIGTVVGNVLVILSVFTYKPLRNVQNMFIVSLAVADIAVAVCVMPFNVAYSIIGRWVFGLRMCEMWLTCDVLCCTASILNLCAIALDRYWAIHDPINYAQKRTLNRVLLMILLVWVFSALISVPPLIGWNDWPDTFTDTTPCKLTEEKGYVIYSSSGSFYIPLVIMTTVYLKIFQATRRRLRERAKAQAAQLALKNKGGSTKSENIPMKNLATTAIAISEVVTTDGSSSSTQKTPHSSPTNQGNSTSQDTTNDGKFRASDSPDVTKNNKSTKRTINNNTNRRTSLSPALTVRQYMEEKQRISLSRERRAARILGIVMGVFVLCWLPFFLMYIVLPFCGGCYVPENMINFITWLGYMNSALNPVIYTIFNKDFRESFRRLLCNKR